MDEGFRTLLSTPLREGPGAPEDVAWALDVTDAPDEARRLDAGCGSRADLLTFARMRPRARPTGIGARAPVAGAAREQLGNGAEVRIGDMQQAGGPLDPIWCAVALDVVGIELGLGAWRRALAPGGAVASTEPIPAWDAAPGSAAPREGFRAADEAGIAARGRAAGRRVPAARGACFRHVEGRTAAPRPGADGALVTAPGAPERQVAPWRADPDGARRARSAVRPA